MKGKKANIRLCAKLVFIVFSLGCVGSSPARSRQALPRIALIGFTHPSSSEAAALSRKVEERLTISIASDARVSLVDEALIRPALSGLGYDGSINLSRDEARRVGAAIGCDFFITGKLEAVTRSERKGESHEEAIAGVMVADGRTGELALFDFILERGSTRAAAVNAIEKVIDQRSAGYLDRIIQLRTGSQRLASNPRSNTVLNAHAAAASTSTGTDGIEDLPDEDSPRAVGFKPPQFLSRVKPGYTTEAEKADITATVELMVVFRSNGEIGSIEITRWAGFGLDQSAEAAVSQFKFSPAQRDGKPISVRAMIRYNFRRLNDLSPEPEASAPQPPDKPDKDLRPLFKPTYRRP
jgi:TonB family protein